MLKRFLCVFAILLSSHIFAQNTKIEFYLSYGMYNNSPMNIPENCRVLPYFKSLEDGMIYYLIDKEPVFTEKEITYKGVSRDYTGLKSISMTLSNKGTSRLAQVTTTHYDKKIIGMVDGVIIIDAYIHSPITSGQLSISCMDDESVLEKFENKPRRTQYSYKELDLINEPESVNSDYLFEVINAFFYYFCKGDEKYKEYIRPAITEEIEELEKTYKKYTFDKIEVARVKVKLIDALRSHTPPSVPTFKIKFYIGDIVYENIVTIFDGQISSIPK